MTNENNPIPLITPDNSAAHSGDVTGENVATLKALFPQIVTDGKVDFDVLRQLLGDAVEVGEERYGLNWKGKAKARAHALTPTLATLRPAKDDSVDWDTTQNLVIEGDNLEVLKTLRKAYAGKVKMIYIDPPYNTGNDFVYPDDYRDSLSNYLELTDQHSSDGVQLTSNKEASGRFHTDWLNMIYPRLLLAKDFLSDDGIIAVSIGAEEISHLLDVCFEVFDRSNFIECVSRVMKSGGAKGTFFTPNIDYIAIFAKNKKAANPFRIEIEQSQIDGYYNKIEDDGPRQGERYGEERLYLPSLDVRPNQRYYIEGPDGLHLIPPGTTLPSIVQDGSSVKPNPNDGVWRWTYGTYLEAKNQGRIIFKRTDTSGLVTQSGEQSPYNVYFKLWLKDQQEKGKVPANMITGIENRKSSKELKDLGIPFDYAKPTELISFLMGMTNVKHNDIVMDFFAGAGTTGHAAYSRGATKNQNFRFILVQLPEPLRNDSPDQAAAAKFCNELGKPRNIAELTKERLRRAGAKLKVDHPQLEIDTGFRVYKLDSSNLKPWQPNPENLERSLLDAVSNIMEGRSEVDLLTELLLKTGIDLTTPEEVKVIADKTVRALGGGALIVCLADIGDEEAEVLGHGLADWQAELDPAGQTTFYFKDTGFASASAKANVAAILRQRLGDKIAKLASI